RVLRICVAGFGAGEADLVSKKGRQRALLDSAARCIVLAIDPQVAASRLKVVPRRQRALARSSAE
ncbi:MAG TPA: hypothetical protein VF175_00820, partial [Lacipirellula sp.]